MDLAVSSIFALVGENVGIQIEGEYVPPNQATWLFYNLRMCTQIVLLIYNVIVLIFSIQQNNLMFLLSVVRCACIISTSLIHHYICTRLWTKIARCEDDLNKKIYLRYLFCALSYYIIGAISAGIDPYFSSDRNAMIVFFLLPFMLRICFVVVTKIYVRMRRVRVDTNSSNHNSYAILCSLLSLSYGLMAILDTTSPWLADRIIISLFMMAIAISFHLAQRSRVAADQRIRQRDSSIVPVEYIVDDNDEMADQRRQSINEALSHHEDGKIMDDDEEVGATSLKDDHVTVNSVNNNNVDATRIDSTNSVNANRVSSRSEITVLVKELLDRKVFTQTKMFVLWWQVALMFLVLLIFELAMSMYIYHRDGEPANWCQPFSFDVFANGLQIIFDYLL